MRLPWNDVKGHACCFALPVGVLTVGRRSRPHAFPPFIFSFRCLLTCLLLSLLSLSLSSLLLFTPSPCLQRSGLFRERGCLLGGGEGSPDQHHNPGARQHGEHRGAGQPRAEPRGERCEIT